MFLLRRSILLPDAFTVAAVAGSANVSGSVNISSSGSIPIGDRDPSFQFDEDDYPTVATTAAEALAKIGDTRAVKPLIKGLYASNNAFSVTAVSALDQLDPEWRKSEQAQLTADELLANIDSDSPVYVSGSAFALGVIGNKRAVKPLITLLNNRAINRSKGTVANALTKLTGQDFGGDYNAWKSYYEGQKGQ